MRKILLAAACLVGAASFAINAQAAPTPKAPQDVIVTNTELDVNVTNTEAHQAIVLFANSHATDIYPTIVTDIDISSPVEILSVTFTISFDAASSIYCTGILSRDLLDTPAGTRQEIFVHKTYTPGTIHHKFAQPILLTADLSSIAVYAGSNECAVNAYVTTRNP